MSEQLELYIKDYEKVEKDNIKAISSHLKLKIALFKKLFDLQQKLFRNHYTGVLDPYYRFQAHERVTLHAYIKTISLLYSAHKLTVNGNFGAANILLRQIFEFLLLGKFVSITKNNTVASNWLESHQLNTYDKIIKLLSKPDKKNFHDYWVIVCGCVHATSSSYQGSFKFKNNIGETNATYALILIMLRCNYHLLSTCFINKRLIYRSEFYGDFSEENKKTKIEAKKCDTEIECLISNHGVSLIRDYQSKWVFKK